MTTFLTIVAIWLVSGALVAWLFGGAVRLGELCDCAKCAAQKEKSREQARLSVS